MTNRKPTPRRKTKKDIQREETRARLLDVARRLFADYGYDDVSVTEIGHEAGVSHSMINVYFGGKPGLLYEIVRENNAPQYEATVQAARGQGDAWARLRAVLLTWARGGGGDPRLLAVMQSYSWVWPEATEDDNRAERDRFIAVLADLVREGQGAGIFEAALPADVTANAIWAIYTWGMRRCVFEEVSPETCFEGIVAQVALILRVGMDRA